MAHTSLVERYEVSVLKKQGLLNSKIDKSVGGHKSSIERKLKRNADGRSKEYRTDLAQKKAVSRHQEKNKHQSFTPEIGERVTYWLKEDYSPEHIKGQTNKDNNRCVSSGDYIPVHLARQKGWRLPLQAFENKRQEVQKAGG